MKRLFFLGLLIVIFNTAANSQEIYARYAFGLEWEPLKNLTMELKPEIHALNFQEPTEWLIDYGLEYNLWKFLEIGGSLRLDHEFDAKNPVYVLRYSADITLKQDVRRFDIQFRTRYSNYTEYDEVPEYRNALRLKGKLGYNIRKCKADPEIFVEYYLRSREMVGFKVKYGGYIDWNLPRRHTLKFGYFYQDYPIREKHIHVVDVTWSYRLK
jgi:hypothetical protein